MHEKLDLFRTRLGAYFENFGTASPSPPELRTTSPLEYLIGVAGVLIVTLALMEPVSSAGLNLLSRTVFWSLHLVPATMVAWVISGWLFNLRASRHVSPWALLAIAGAITGLLLAPISVTLEVLFGVFDVTDPQSKPLSFTSADWLNELKDELHDVPLTTASVWPAMNAFVVWRMSNIHHDNMGNPQDEARSPDLLFKSQVQTSPAMSSVLANEKSDRREASIASKQQKSKDETPGFLSRLPPRLGRDIVFVEAQEHYLRIVTTRGEHLLLQGFTHSIAELQDNGFDGVQIHRSVWVAWKHVENVDVRTGSMAVILSTGVCLKIGRRRAKSVLSAWGQRLT